MAIAVVSLLVTVGGGAVWLACDAVRLEPEEHYHWGHWYITGLYLWCVGFVPCSALAFIADKLVRRRRAVPSVPKAATA